VLDGVDPKRTSFSTNKKVRESGDQLYQGIVDAIRDMIVLLSPEKPERPDEDGTTKRRCESGTYLLKSRVLGANYV
jgi:hypothetical protein